jgi:hypothetical protein
MLQKSMVLQIQGSKGTSCGNLPRTLDNEGVAVPSAFLKVKQPGDSLMIFGCNLK